MRISALVCAVALAGGFSAVAKADTIYTDYAAWLTAVSARGELQDISLTPALIPQIGLPTNPPVEFVDDEGTLAFDQNTGNLRVYEDGWGGNIQGPTYWPPHYHTFTFVSPIVAFGGFVNVGSDTQPQFDRVIFTLGDTSTTLSRLQYDTLAFFGWVGDSATSEVRVTTDTSQLYYDIRQTQYVTAQVVPLPAATAQVVPLPAAAWGGLALLGGLGLAKRPWRSGGISFEISRQ